jgi:hypothetical protein
MGKWLTCASALCLAFLLAACGEEEAKNPPKTPVDWAIDPEATDEQRRILRAGLEIVFAECPAFAALDWQAIAEKTGNFSQGATNPVTFYKSNSDNTPSRPMQIVMSRPYIDGWTHFGAVSAESDDFSISWSVRFSWTEPPGITTQTREDPVKDAAKKKLCDFNEKVTREWDGRVYWFKRVDALAEIVTD